jgi:hypothetical protein
VCCHLESNAIDLLPFNVYFHFFFQDLRTKAEKIHSYAVKYKTYAKRYAKKLKDNGEYFLKVRFQICFLGDVSSPLVY